VVRVLVIALLLGACVAESDHDHPPQTVTILPDEPKQDGDGDTDTTAICNAAAALPEGELCALVCDPDAFKARLIDDGMAPGNCYQLRCDLAPDMSVTVGVCLP
jgi:hypothetical protein